jgi:ferritin-like metal-binding protein YciE
MPGPVINEKIVQYFNEALAMENAAVERIESRIDETPVKHAKQQLQYHLEQTRQQQNRLKELITKMGGSPTDTKAVLPKVMPVTMDTISNKVKETAKSITDDGAKETMDAEKELLRTKEDAIIESSEVISYKMLMEIAEKAGLKDAIPVLNQSLKEETAMVNFIMGNAPMMLRLIWPKLAPEDSTIDEKEGKVSMAAKA